jgi:hypothetical protein
MDTTQVLLVIVVTVLTVLLSVIGIQVAFILAELKKTIEKINKMLDDGGMVTGGIAKGVTGMGGLLEGIKTGLNVVNLFKKKETT